MYNFENILDRHNNGSKKWNLEYIEKRFQVTNINKYFPLFIADMDFKLPSEIINPIIDITSQGDFGYFDVKKSFYNSVIKWYKNKYNCEIEKNWIVPSISAIATMNVILEYLFHKNDRILIFTPVYGPFKDVITNNEFELVSSNLLLENDTYKIDFCNLEKQLDKFNVKGIILCNPHNPSGVCWTKNELNKLIDICKSRNIIIISDEVHGDLTLANNKFNSLSKYLNYYKKIIIISSPNKTFNIAGLDISTFLCSDNELKLQLENTFSKKKLHPNRIGCEVLTICYEKGANWVNSLCFNIKENIELVTKMLNIDGIKVIKPDAGYLLWVKLEGIKDIDNFIINLAKETGVLLETGSRFVGNNNDFLRINVATNKKILKEAINSFLHFYKNYKK